MSYLTFRKYASLKGVSVQSVSKAVRSGRISTVQVDGREMIDPKVADREWEENTNHNKSRRTKLQRMSNEDPPPASGELTYAKARAARELYEAKLAELKYKEKAKDLVKASDVKRAWIKQITAAKTKILSISASCKSRYAGLPLEVVALIDEICRETLEDIAKNLEMESVDADED